MREIVFRVQERSGGTLSASAEHLPLTIEAATLEELQHEARDLLIQHFGPSHVAYRVRMRRPGHRIQPLRHGAVACHGGPA